MPYPYQDKKQSYCRKKDYQPTILLQLRSPLRKAITYLIMPSAASQVSRTTDYAAGTESTAVPISAVFYVCAKHSALRKGQTVWLR